MHHVRHWQISVHFHLCGDGEVEVEALDRDGARGADQVGHGGKDLVVSGGEAGGDGQVLGEVAEGELVGAGRYGQRMPVRQGYMMETKDLLSRRVGNLLSDAVVVGAVVGDGGDAPDDAVVDPVLDVDGRGHGGGDVAAGRGGLGAGDGVDVGGCRGEGGKSGAGESLEGNHFDVCVGVKI